MNRRTQILTVDQRDKKFAVATRVCGNSDPPFVVYQGASAAESVAHFFDVTDAWAYVDWRNSLLIRERHGGGSKTTVASSLPGRAAGGHPRNGT
jgi:hypothetical protein